MISLGGVSNSNEVAFTCRSAVVFRPNLSWVEIVFFFGDGGLVELQTDCNWIYIFRYFVQKYCNLGLSGPRAASKNNPGESFVFHKFENLDEAFHSNIFSWPSTQVVRFTDSIFWLVANETVLSPKS